MSPHTSATAAVFTVGTLDALRGAESDEDTINGDGSNTGEPEPAAPAALPAVIIKVAGYLAVASTVLGAVSQTAVEGE